jgi:predicted RNase H-like HicB family nuclease
MKYAVVFEQGPTSVGATVPDLPGCFAVGPSMEETRRLVAEAIEFHIRCLKEAGDVVPEPSHHAEDVDVAA